MQNIVELKKVSKLYEMGKVEVTALWEVDLTLSSGEFIAISGPSGSGKTTMLNLIGCLDAPSKGEVLVDGIDVQTLKDDDSSELRNRKLGFIFQSFNLIPVLNVYENIEFPLLFQNPMIPKNERRKRISELIDSVDLNDYINQRPNQLSGGQQQRVAIARSLVTRPRLVLADEPTANLDSDNGNKIMELMQRLNRDVETTFIFSTHDPLVLQYARRNIKLKDGRIVEDNRREN